MVFGHLAHVFPHRGMRIEKIEVLCIDCLGVRLLITDHTPYLASDWGILPSLSRTLTVPPPCFQWASPHCRLVLFQVHLGVLVLHVPCVCLDGDIGFFLKAREDVAVVAVDYKSLFMKKKVTLTHKKTYQGDYLRGRSLPSYIDAKLASAFFASARFTA